MARRTRPTRCRDVLRLKQCARVLSAPPPLGGRYTSLPALGVRGTPGYSRPALDGGRHAGGPFARNRIGLRAQLRCCPYGRGARPGCVRPERSPCQAAVVAYPVTGPFRFLHLGIGARLEPHFLEAVRI